MTLKSANVVARVEPAVKEQAEAIMAELGIPASTAINMFYRQIIQERGMPFKPALSQRRPRALDEMSKEEFDQRMAAGLAQAQSGRSKPATEALSALIEEFGHERKTV